MFLGDAVVVFVKRRGLFGMFTCKMDFLAAAAADGSLLLLLLFPLGLQENDVDTIVCRNEQTNECLPVLMTNTMIINSIALYSSMSLYRSLEEEWTIVIINGRKIRSTDFPSV
jgi:hypothetical protein